MVIWPEDTVSLETTVMLPESEYIVMSPKMLSDAIHREIKMNIGVCEVYLALEAMRHNNAIYVYCMSNEL